MNAHCSTASNQNGFNILYEIQDFARNSRLCKKNSRFSTERMHVIYIRRLVLDILDAFSNEWYEKNPQHLSLLGAWFGSGAMRISG